ncbi:uncharacterized protein [Asterias amurensis]|uniref:uncharacterized protein n=1 Tax=Asterias amurensis TaxID=7602 RepID=UPI003AB84DFA
MEKQKLPASSAVNHPSKKKLKVDSTKAPLSKSKPNSSKDKALNKSSKKQKPNSKENVWWFTQKAKKQEKKNAGTTETSKTVTNANASPKSSKTELKAIKKKALQVKKKRQRKNRLLKKKLKSGGNTEDVMLKDSGDSELPTSVSLQKSGRSKQKRKKAKKFKGVKTAKDGGQIAPRLKETQVNGESTEEDSTKKEKDSSKGGQVETKPASTKALEKVNKGEVSSNWKALLPMVEKSRNERQTYKKKNKSVGEIKEYQHSNPDIWFDDVDPSLIRANENEGADIDEDDVQSETGHNPLLRKDAKDGATKCLAIDCEMVGTGPKGCKSILARVSIVNQYGYCVCDKYITPQEPVTDYRTFVSGIRPQDLKTKGESFEVVQKEVADLLKGRIVVGHALSNDFKVLYFNHPRRLVRDTSTYQPFKDLFKSKRPGLKKLTELVLKVKVQKGEHNSVEDAQAAMKLYMLHRKQWEKSIREKKISSTGASSNKTHKLGKTTPI